MEIKVCQSGPDPQVANNWHRGGSLFTQRIDHISQVHKGKNSNCSACHYYTKQSWLTLWGKDHRSSCFAVCLLESPHSGLEIRLSTSQLLPDSPLWKENPGKQTFIAENSVRSFTAAASNNWLHSTGHSGSKCIFYKNYIQTNDI